MKKLSQAIVLASAMTAGLASVQTVHAEVSASVDVANNYIFRGVLMGSGDPAVSGALDYAHSSGAYAGVWATSGDATGDEYNVYFGFGGEAGDVSYDVNLLSYVYPVGKIDAGDYIELTGSVGYKGLGLSVSVPVEFDGEDYVYTNLSYGYEAFGIALGNVTSDAEDSDYTHVDLSYSFNDNVSFMVSKIVDGDISQRTLFQVSYSLPISL